MHIELLRLKHYKRLMMSNIQMVEWTPTKPMMVIIGSNGSGKSSLLDELTPCPARHAQFAKGGEKTLHCRHGNSRYVLHSVYDRGTGHHSFKKDDVELNPGFTYAVQEDLVWQEFGMARDLHELLTGRTRFTHLSTAKRREWLTRMSTIDLDYAFEISNAIRKEHRNQLGVIDHITRRLSKENLDLLDDASLNLKRGELKRLTERVNRLFQERTPGKNAQFRSVGEAQSQLDDIIGKAKQLLRRYPVLSGAVCVTGRDGYQSQVNAQQQEYRAVQAVVDHLVEELEKLRSSTPQSVDRMSPEEIQALRDQHKELCEEAEYFSSKFQTYTGVLPVVTLSMYGDPSAKLTDAFDRWYTLLQTIPENADGFMNNQTANENRTRLEDLKGKRRQIEDLQLQTARRISTLKGCEHVVCPSCTHEFRPGVSATEQSDLEAKLAKVSDALTRIEAEIKTLEQYMEQYQEYSGYAYNFMQLTKDHSELQLVWEHCAETLLMYRTPRKHSTAVIEWHEAMQRYIGAEQAIDKARNIEHRLKVIEAIDLDVVGYMQQRTTELETEITDRSLEMAGRSSDLQMYQRSGRSIEAFVEEANKLADEYSALMSKYQDHAEFLLDKAFEEEIQASQIQLADAQRVLSAMERRETELRMLETEVETATLVHSDLGLLAKAMSPNGGIIGRYLLGFLQGVTSIVNAVIEEVWTYPMEVLPSKVEKEELDYKFPLKVAGGAVMAADIELGSDSQLEMVNFAFRIAAIKFLGLEDFPLFLDEFGRTFDEQHRANSIPFISRFIELGTFNQVFFISHYSTVHGAFNQAEILVLDPTNIVVPTDFNKNVRLA